MRRLAAISLSIIAVTWTFAAIADDWPAWRGPRGTGVTAEQGLPLEWSNEKNVLWKMPLPGPGNSTPIVQGGRVFLTSASNKGQQRSLLCFDAKSGKLLWTKTVKYDGQQPTHKTNPYCSSSPVTDGQRVIAWHGSAGVHAYDYDGKELWSKDLGEFRHIWGTASSPVIWKDLVIISAGPGLRAFVAALKKDSGEEVWRYTTPSAVARKIGEFRGSWSTPVLHEIDGQTQLVLSLPNLLVALDPQTGKPVWQSRGLGDLVYTSPLVSDSFVVAMSGYHGPALAVKAGGQGEITETHRLWRHSTRKDLPQRVGSGVLAGGHVYILNEPGEAWCINAQTGEIKWRLPLGKRRGRGFEGRSWSSLLLAGDRMYALAMSGDTYVLAVDPEKGRLLAHNPIGEMTRASLAAADGRLYLRTYEHLYCIGKN